MMLDAPLAPTLDVEADDQTGRPAQSRLKIIDGDVHPALRSVDDLKALPADALARAPGDLRLAAQARHELRALSEVDAARLPARCLAGGRRQSGLGPGPDPLAVPRRLRHRVRHPGAARPVRPQRAQPGVLGRPDLGRQRLAARLLHQARAAPQVRHRRCRPRTRRPRWPRSSAAPTILPIAQVFMLTRTSEPLGNRRYWPIYAAAERHGLPIGLHVFGSGGHAYTGTGLALLLRRGGCRALDLVPDGGDQPRHRGRVRALPAAQGRHDRRRLRLAAGAVVAPRQAVRAHAQRGAAPEDEAVGVHPPATSG